MKRLTLIIVVLLTALLVAPVSAQDVLDGEEAGKDLLDTYCSSCHAIGMDGMSPHPEAPPFRELHLRYDVELLSEALVEGLVSGHPDMPEFEFDPEQAAAIVAYLRSLED